MNLWSRAEACCDFCGNLPTKFINGGLALSRYFEIAYDFLVCVTETNSREQIDELVEGLKAVS